jgi:hypothetical protein
VAACGGFKMFGQLGLAGLMSAECVSAELLAFAPFLFSDSVLIEVVHATSPS